MRLIFFTWVQWNWNHINCKEAIIPQHLLRRQSVTAEQIQEKGFNFIILQTEGEGFHQKAKQTRLQITTKYLMNTSCKFLGPKAFKRCGTTAFPMDSNITVLINNKIQANVQHQVCQPRASQKNVRFWNFEIWIHWTTINYGNIQVSISIENKWKGAIHNFIILSANFCHIVLSLYSSKGGEEHKVKDSKSTAAILPSLTLRLWFIRRDYMPKYFAH